MKMQMLKYIVVALVAMVATAWAVEVSTTKQAADAPPPVKACSIVTVNIISAFDQLEEKKHADASLAARFKDAEEEFQARIKDFQALTEQVRKMEPGEEQKRKASEMKMEQTKLEAFRDKNQADVEAAQVELTTKLYAKMIGAIEDLRAKNGYDAVLTFEKMPDTRNMNRSGVIQMVYMRRVVAANPQIDLTPALVAAMNSAYAEEQKK